MGPRGIEPRELRVTILAPHQTRPIVKIVYSTNVSLIHCMPQEQDHYKSLGVNKNARALSFRACLPRLGGGPGIQTKMLSVISY